MWDNLQLLFVWAPIINLQVILDGIFVGAVFALSAYGLALVWGVMNIKNLAQGDFVILGGYLAFALHAYHVPLILILLIVMPLMFVFGWFIYVIMIRRILDQDMFVSLLATFGLSLLLQQFINLIFGPEVQTIDMKTEEREVKSSRRCRKKCRATEERRRDPASAAERRVEL